MLPSDASGPAGDAGRWAWITVLLYGAALTLISGPFVLAAFPEDIERSDIARALRAALNPEESWGFWALIGTLTLLEGMILLVPVRIADRRPVRRGRWGVLAATAGLLMGLLLTAAGFTLHEVATKGLPDKTPGWIYAGLGVAGWVVWGVVFALLPRRMDHASALRSVVRRLLTGSIAELLVAVPCHVIARKRDYCCAGAATFTGLAAGFVVLLFAFGPAVLFLFVDRFRRLRPAALRTGR